MVIAPDVLEGQCGTVRWSQGDAAGIELATPLYGPVVEHLYREYATFRNQDGMRATGPVPLAA